MASAVLPAGTQVERDGVAFVPAGLGVALPVDPGTHHVVVRAPGHAERSYSIEIAEAQRLELAVEAGPALEPEPEPEPVPVPPLPSPKPPALPPAPPQSTTLRDVGIFFLALGGVAGIGASFAGAITIGAHDQLESECPNKVCREPKAREAADRGQISGPITTVALVAFGAGVTLGGILVGVGTTREDAPAALFELGPGRVALHVRF